VPLAYHRRSADASARAAGVANVLPCVDCIDESRTVGEKWTESDGRPDKVGMYRTIVYLFVDPTRIAHDIFRVQGWKICSRSRTPGRFEQR